MIKINESRILILDLLDILKKYSDRTNPLTQQNIIEILENNYGYSKVRRQTIQSNLEKMIDHYELEDRVIRLAAEDDYFNSEDAELLDLKRRITDIYYEHKLSDPELLLIIDSILFSKQIPVGEREKLIEKLEDLSSNNFSSRMGNISSLSISNKKDKDIKDNPIFSNISKIDEAITEAKKISFKYNSYIVKENKIKLETRKDHQGMDRKYIINPFYMAASNGRYYLICNNDSFDNISTYRVDRITDIKILSEKRKSAREVSGLGENFNLNDYMAENIYMFGGKSEYIKLVIKDEFLDEFLDWFNSDDINVQERKDGKIILRVKSNRMAMRRWAFRYALYVRILSPEDLANEVKGDLQEALKNYSF